MLTYGLRVLINDLIYTTRPDNTLLPFKDGNSTETENSEWFDGDLNALTGLAKS